jgi:hypothetical protein
MSGKKQVSGKFKSKGSSILHTGKDRPDSMHEFLFENDKPCTNTQNRKNLIEQSHEGSNIQNHKNTLTQKHGYAKTQESTEEKKLSSIKNSVSETVERIHVQIRKELADKLIETVYARKREGKCKKKDATQRQIIEQALEEYFEREGF